MTPELFVTLIVAFLGVGSAVWTSKTAISDARIARLNSERTETQMEHLRNSLASQAADQDARRDYEYEARKRLYRECEPLLFRLVDASDDLASRTRRIAEAARIGYLGLDGHGWLVGTGGYFFKSTLYRLLAPHVYVHLLEETLTTVDLTLDRDIWEQFLLARQLSDSITDDIDLAKIEPTLDYDPNHVKSRTLQIVEPAKYRHQGLYAGQLDAAVEFMVVKDSGIPPRCMSYAEFEAIFDIMFNRIINNENEEIAQDYQNNEIDMRKKIALQPAVELLLGFHPENLPVFWRVLVVQALICEKLHKTQARRLSKGDDGQDDLLALLPVRQLPDAADIS